MLMGAVGWMGGKVESNANLSKTWIEFELQRPWQFCKYRVFQ